MEEAGVDAAQVLAALLLGLGFAAVVGSLTLAFRIDAIGADQAGFAAPWRQRATRRVRWFSILAGAIALVAAFVVLWLEVATMAEVSWLDAAPVLWPMLKQTHYGAAASAGLFSLLLVLGGSVLGLKTLAGRIVACLGVIGFATSRSLVSHAAGAGDLSADVVVETLHLLAISAWVGEVLAAAVVMLPAIGETSDVGSREAGVAYLQGLSRSATLALAVVVGSGLYNTVQGLGLLRSQGVPAVGIYAGVLGAKLVVVAIAAMLGGFNRWVAMPDWITALKAPARRGAAEAERPRLLFTRVLRIEAVVLVAALALAALLSATARPAGAQSVTLYPVVMRPTG